MSDTDRTVHATIHSNFGWRTEVVRYDRAGKWYIEPVPGHSHKNDKRTRVTLGEAVAYVLAMRKAGALVVHLDGRKGGSQFDRRVA